MLVAHVVDYIDKFGGMKTHVYSLARGLKKRNIQSVIIAPQSSYQTGWDKTEPSILWISIDRADADALKKLALLNNVFALMQDRDVDIIHAHSTSGYILGNSLAYALRVPLIFTMHGGWLYFYSDACMSCGKLDYSNLCTACVDYPEFFTEKTNKHNEYMLKGMYLSAANQIIVLNKASFDHCNIFFGIPEDRLTIKKLWVNLPDQSNIEHNKLIASVKYKLHRNSKVILWVGTNRNHKRVDIVFQAFEHLLYKLNNIELWIAGLDLASFSEKTKNFDNHVLSKINNLGILNDDEISIAYSGADVLWQPSVWESVSYVLLEAMAHYLPCIAISDLDNKDLFDGGEPVHFVSKDDYLAFADKTADIFLRPPDEERVERARKRILENHSEDICINSIVDLYKSTIEKYKSVRGLI